MPILYMTPPTLCEYCIPAVEAGDSMSHLASPSRQRGTNATACAFQREAQERSFLGRFCKESNGRCSTVAWKGDGARSKALLPRP